MKRTSYILWEVFLIILFLLSAPYAWYLLKVIFASGNLLGQLEIFKWAAVGFVGFAIVRRLIKGNLTFVETFSHELTHTVFAFLFNLRVVEFHANSGSGYMMATQRNMLKALPISLSPYCFPLFTFFLLAFRWMMNFHGIWIYDIIIGISICFHLYCFKTQIGNYQTDINQYPLLLSYTYIVTSWLLVFCVIVPAFFPNMNGHGTVQPIYNYGIFSSIWRLLEFWWNAIIVLKIRYL